VVGKDGDARGGLADIAVEMQEVLEGGDCFGQAGQFGIEGRGKNAAEGAGSPCKEGTAGRNNIGSACRGTSPEIGVRIGREIRERNAPRDYHFPRVSKERGDAAREGGESGVRKIALA
jgi:hypothetical protein